jgi:hypothetical protein
MKFGIQHLKVILPDILPVHREYIHPHKQQMDAIYKKNHKFSMNTNPATYFSVIRHTQGRYNTIEYVGFILPCISGSLRGAI